MRKSFKKLLTVATAATMTIGALSLASCGPVGTHAVGNPDGAAHSNGGFVVSVDDSTTGGYYYFINGVETYTSDNTYGAPVKGSLMRVKKSELAENKAETVIPSLMVAGDYTAGIFIYSGRVYYATPTNVKNTSGVVENSYLDFKSAALDGTDIKDLFRLESNTTVYRFVEVNGTVYALYVEGTSTYTLHSYNTKSGVDTVLFKDATSYVLDSSDKENPTVYYTMNVVDRMDSDSATTLLYNQVYRVNAATTEATAPYTYEWDKEWLDDNDGEAPYTNLGTIVFDGIGGNDKKTQFNHSESTPISPLGYSYKLRSYNNGGLYFTRTQTNGVGGDLYFIEESELSQNWDSVADNEANGGKLTKLANSIDAASKATTSAFFYTEGEGANLTHHYLYVSNSSMFRVDIGNGGVVESEIEVAYDIGSATIVGIDASSDATYNYVYFTRTNSAGLSVERAVYNGTAENYKNLTFNGENNEAYESVKVLNIQHVSGWYNYEILDDTVFYVDAETFGGTAYSYASCVSLKNAKGNLMNNVELKEFNDLYDSIVNSSDKTVGLFAKLNDTFGDSDLSNAIRYYFYTGETAQFQANINDAVAEGQKEAYLYTEDEQAAFEAFAAGKSYTFKSNNTEKELFAADTYVDANGKSYRTYDYFRTQLGKRTDADNESYAEYWKTSGLKRYTAPETEDEGLAWWAWMLIGIAIAVVVAAAAFVCVYFFVIKKKGEGEKVERLKVVTQDDKDIDVYAEETPVEETPAEEPVEEVSTEEETAEPVEEPVEEAPVEEAVTPAEETPVEETPAEEAPAAPEQPSENPEE